MNRYMAGSPVLELHGALYSEVRHDGSVRPHRLPQVALERVPSVFMRAAVDAAAGVRIRCTTAADRLEFEVAIRPIKFVGSPEHQTKIDLVVDGTLVESRRVDGGRIVVDNARGTMEERPSPRQIIVFGGLGDERKTVEIWLPHNAVVDVFLLRTSSQAAPVKSIPRLWIHHGSSISHCLEAESPTGMWPAVAARELDFDLVDLGFAGSAMLDPFVARAIRDQSADLISLKLGINLVNVDLMKMRAFVPAVDGFLDTIRDGHPDTPILVISPIICPVAEVDPGPMGGDPDTGQAISLSVGPISLESLTLERIRDSLESIVDRRSVADPAISYLDGRKLFGLSDMQSGDLPDGLHPSARGYELMGRRFADQYRSKRYGIGPRSVALDGE